MNIIDSAKFIFDLQSRSILSLKEKLDEEFICAVEYIHNCSSKVIVSGIGKSGIIGRKIAATLASTGTPSFFVHPAEAYHGDLGMIGAGDLVILISYSGESDEVIKLLPYLNHVNAKTISITGNPNSTLAKSVDVNLDVYVEREACPNNLAPTTSTTATLVMGDALAITLMELRGFQPKDFARFHPGGSLGQKLLTQVSTVMSSIKVIDPDLIFEEVVHAVTEGTKGVVCVVDDKGALIGVITDGDLRRAFECSDYSKLMASDVMNKKPTFVMPSTSLYDCSQIMHDRKLTSLIVVEYGCPIGVVKSFDV